MINMSTINSILKRETENYLENLDKDNMPTPEEIEDELLSRFESQLTSELRCSKRDIPKALPNSVIAEIVMKIHHIKRLVWSETGNNRNYDTVIYQTEGENEGVYVSDFEAFYSIINRYNYNIKIPSVKEVIDILSAKAPKCRRSDNPDLIAVNNGIFDYKKKELIPFTPDIVFTSKSRVNYNPNAVNPIIYNDTDGTNWDVESWMSDLSNNPEIVKLLWQVLSAIIRPNVPWNKVVCMYSEKGNNGKGTLCKLMRNLCGDGNSAAIPFASFADRFMLEQLTHVSAIIADENPTKAFTKEVASLKAIITGDGLSIDRKFKEPITMRFKGLMVQCINDLPKFGDKTESLYRRLLFIPFDKCFTGYERKYIKNDYLNRKEVLEYVLYKVLNSSFYEFDEPLECSLLLEEYKIFSDPIKTFIDEILPKLKWPLVPNEFLYDLYKAWFKENYPTGTIQGKNTFLKDFRNSLADSKDWIVQNTAVPRGDKLKEPELLIEEYNLTKWMNKHYIGGNDSKKKCTINPTASSYKGIVRIKNSNSGFQAVS